MAINPSALSRLTQNVESALSQALSSLTGKEYLVAPAATQEWPVAESSFIWQQSITVVDGPAFWLVAAADLWEALGRQTLEAAGIDAASTEEIRSTWQEIVNQTASGVANAIAANLVRDVAAAGGEILAEEPDGLTWTVFSVSDERNKQWLFKAAWSEALGALYSEGESTRSSASAGDLGASRTLDLLLDVAMPVCVSFGRTSLQIREVLKLNTGSIVELNRFVSDPVEVVVNDCVIARGEVVVVDGNYGVRISHLASREDRLRTGMNEAVSSKLK